MFGGLAVALLCLKAVWANGFRAGTLGEAKLWLGAVDSLMVPNWQSLPVPGDDSGMTPEQIKWMNQVYVQAYALALQTIMTEIAEARRDIVVKAAAEEERLRRRFER
jgi:hypothetical protein